MRALSIRQPYAELILRGLKTVEYRSQTTHIIGERFWIYASKKPVGGRRSAVGGEDAKGGIWSKDLGTGTPQAWMWELADSLILGELPTGVIVGTAVIDRVTPPQRPDAAGWDALFQWHLTDVRRAKTLRKPVGHPQPVWWRTGDAL